MGKQGVNKNLAFLVHPSRINSYLINLLLITKNAGCSLVVYPETAGIRG